jgi:hypothetical protein
MEARESATTLDSTDSTRPSLYHYQTDRDVRECATFDIAWSESLL